MFIDLPAASLRVRPGATVLAVAESDRSSFVIVADGTIELAGADRAGPLDRGAIAMIDAAGVTQIDQATESEIEADPIVAENLSLDAEL